MKITLPTIKKTAAFPISLSMDSEIPFVIVGGRRGRVRVLKKKQDTVDFKHNLAFLLATNLCKSILTVTIHILHIQ